VLGGAKAGVPEPPQLVSVSRTHRIGTGIRIVRPIPNLPVLNNGNSTPGRRADRSRKDPERRPRTTPTAVARERWNLQLSFNIASPSFGSLTGWSVLSRRANQAAANSVRATVQHAEDGWVQPSVLPGALIVRSKTFVRHIACRPGWSCFLIHRKSRPPDAALNSARVLS